MYEVEIRNGLELLDEKLGRDVWLPRVNALHISMTSCVNCIAAQATGETYAEALVTLGLMSVQEFQVMRADLAAPVPENVHEREAFHGFEIAVPILATMDRLMINTSHLEREWKNTIKALQFPKRYTTAREAITNNA